MVDLVAHLRVLGESNAVRSRRRALRRDTALASAAAYHAMFGAADVGEATVVLLTLPGLGIPDLVQSHSRPGPDLVQTLHRPARTNLFMTRS